MATTLKAAPPLEEKNIPRLVVVVVANFLAFTAFVRGSALIGGDPYATLKSFIDLLPAGLGLVLMSVANGLLDHKTNERLVFWRWSHPLPGARSFTVHVKTDPRINVPALRAALGAFPKSEAEQNGVWYKLYNSIQSEPAVTRRSGFLLEHPEHLR